MEKLFNDSVHGHIRLPALCVKIIDTPEFQRLRNLKQLGLAYLVYPGASHNRFEHCLGVSHLAGLVAENLNRNRIKKTDPKITTEEKLCLQVAGLCHDLGHGPFSHTWEKFVHKRGDENWKHEDMSLNLFDLILQNKEVENEFRRSTLVDYHKKMIKDFIKGNTPKDATKAFLYEIVANNDTGIDVDKWDYLLRDSKHLNIGITFDPHRLMYCQCILKTDDEKYHICYRDKASPEIWQMYMMRGELYRKAYHHPVVKILEEMWLDALIHFEESGYQFLGKPLSQVHQFPSEYARLTDGIFQELYRLEENKFENGLNLLKRIQERKLYKVWRHEKLTENDLQGREESFKDINKTIEQKLEAVNSVYTTLIDMNINFEDLERKVITYNKKYIPNRDWSSNPLRLSSLQHLLNRHEVIFYSKSTTSSEDTEHINDKIENILKEVLERRDAH